MSLIIGECDTTNADYLPPSHCEFPAWVTNFIPYNINENALPLLDEWGNLTFPEESNYQCQSPCNITAGGLEITKADIGYYAACIRDWLGWHIEVDGQELWCVDNYGNPRYQEPFYHEGLGTWVVGIDVMTHEPLGYLTYDWEK